MRKRAAFRFTLAGTLLGITLVNVGAAGSAHAESPISITISVVEAHPNGPEGELPCVGGAGTWTCDGSIAGTYDVGAYLGPLSGVASASPVPVGASTGSLPSTGTDDIVVIVGFAVLLAAIGAGLSTLARRPVR
jgi:hypothetical protein